MLQQQNLIEQQEEEAARVRVTMDELARAVARYETRKLDETQVPANTMTVGEAIEQLSLTATPEELLAEVEAERRRAEEAAKLQNPPWKSQERLAREQTQEVRKTRSVRRKFAV